MKKKLQKINFSGKKFYVGLDVHLKTWYITIINEYVQTHQNVPADAEKLYNYLSTRFPGAEFHIAYEAGFTGFSTYDELVKYGFNVKVINPADIPTTDKEQRVKTDRKDSEKIAKSLKADLLTGIYVPTKKMREDRGLIRCRAQMVRDMTRIKNRIKSMLYLNGVRFPEHFAKPSTHWSKNFVNWLESLGFYTDSGDYTLQCYVDLLKFYRGKILSITRVIREMSKQPYYDRNYRILISAPGIGMITAMTLLTELCDITRFKELNKLLSYIGLTPTEHSSGENQWIGGMTKRQNRHIRGILIEAAWVAMRSDPALMQYYNHARTRMEPGKAIVKVAKKLTSKIYKIWNNNEMYVTGVA